MNLVTNVPTQWYYLKKVWPFRSIGRKFMVSHYRSVPRIIGKQVKILEDLEVCNLSFKMLMLGIPVFVLQTCIPMSKWDICPPNALCSVEDMVWIWYGEEFLYRTDYRYHRHSRWTCCIIYTLYRSNCFDNVK